MKRNTDELWNEASRGEPESPLFDSNDVDVAVVIGTGPAGATLALELARAGQRVVLFEAGPWIDPASFINDDRAAFEQMSWTDPREATGTWQLARDFPGSPAWMGKLVGGTANLWTGLTPRFKAHELRASETYGRIPDSTLIDWPIGLNDLENGYDQAERAVGATHRQGRPPLPANNNYKVVANGAARIGYTHYATGPYAVNAEPYDCRPATIQDGFASQGDKQRSKWTPLVSEIPRALASGLVDLRTRCHVTRITLGANGRADGVVFADADGILHRQRARFISVACNAIETARLLLLSSTAGHQNGLANGSDQVGRNYMRHTSGVIYAEFEQPVHMYRGEPMAGLIADESRHDPSRGFVGGYYFEMISQGLASFSQFNEPGGWGVEFASRMEAYTRTSALWICGEDLPQATNRVTLSDSATDALGLPVPVVHYDDHSNDIAMRMHAYDRAEELFSAVGAVRITTAPPLPSGHNLGTARMSLDAESGVVDPYGRAHEVDNLFISDGSVFPTSGAANPTLTIMSLVYRQAAHIIGALRSGEL
ncbi:GMC family oxidoreductase [Humibacter ginsenosidimutans]|uniref:GMC family oxidoreductase n=2 Tax=Humibacter ginsenosidimutans TaxID=2599293 RepID=A0A5B8M902_9MICO|nr:GMC family oxidoreductase [Humibacter ginsenosidimutans]